MMILRDGSAASLHAFVTEHVEPGATVITDAWQGYRGINSSATPTNRAANGPLAPAAAQAVRSPSSDRAKPYAHSRCTTNAPPSSASPAPPSTAT